MNKLFSTPPSKSNIISYGGGFEYSQLSYIKMTVLRTKKCMKLFLLVIVYTTKYLKFSLVVKTSLASMKEVCHLTL